MMQAQSRMSPITALVLGIFGVGAVGIGSGTAVVLYGLHVADSKASQILDIAENTIADLPDLMERLPALSDQLAGRRAIDYGEHVDVDVRFAPHERRGGLRPVLTVSNKSDEVISMLAVRVVALDKAGVPIREWTQVVATPLAIEDEWRGPLWPGETRYVLVGCWPTISEDRIDGLTAVTEISEIRLWEAGTGL